MVAAVRRRDRWNVMEAEQVMAKQVSLLRLREDGDKGRHGGGVDAIRGRWRGSVQDEDTWEIEDR